MGFLDAILGRGKPVRPDLDRLFALPSAAVTLEAAAGFVPTGLGSVCFASVEGEAFARLRRDVRELLDADAGTDAGGVPVEFSQDTYGYTWLEVRHGPGEVADVVNDLHAVNTLLQEGGFGPQLLCSLLGFRAVDEDDPHRLALVYLYKRGTFYPFAPLPDAGTAGRAGTEGPPGPEGAAGTAGVTTEKRDNALELRIRSQLADDLRIEEDLSRWFPVWGAPGL